MKNTSKKMFILIGLLISSLCLFPLGYKIGASGVKTKLIGAVYTGNNSHIIQIEADICNTGPCVSDHTAYTIDRVVASICGQMTRPDISHIKVFDVAPPLVTFALECIDLTTRQDRDGGK